MTTKEYKTYENIGERLFSDTLPNGLAVKVLTKPGFSKTYAFFATNYGGADRRFKLAGQWLDTPAGVAHFLEHKMFDTPDGGNALALLSANGASPNAYTSSGITAYHFSCTKGFEENLETLLKFVSVPYFTQESVEKEQGIISQEIRMIEDDPGFVAYQNLMRCLFEHNPIRDSVAGTVESISQITAQTLYNCHRVFYNPSNMVLCVVGDVEPEEVSNIARRIVTGDPGEIPARDYGADENKIKQRSLANMEVSAPIFLLGARFLPHTGSALMRQKLLGSLALESLIGRSSAFYTKLYAEGLLNAHFGSELDFAAGAGMVMAEGESTDPERVYAEFLAAAEAVARSGFDSDYFRRQKKAAYGGRLRALNIFEAQCRRLADGHFFGYNPLEAFEILDSITADDASRFIADILAPDRIAMSVVSPTVS